MRKGWFKKAKHKWFKNNIFSFNSTYYACHTYHNNYGICKFEKGNPVSFSCYGAIEVVYYLRSKLKNMSASDIFFYLKKLKIKTRENKENILLYYKTIRELESEVQGE